MRRNRKENMWNQVQRFSIRKFSFGVTSALLGTVFLANASMVHAETGNGETPAVAVEATNGNSGTTEKAATNVDSTTTEKAEVEKNTLPSAVKPEENSNQALSSERITEDKKVNKNELTEVIEKLSTLLNKVDQDNVSRTSMLEFEKALSKAKEVLQNDSATQADIDAQVRKVLDAISNVKSITNVDNETSQPKENNGVTAEQTKTVAEVKKSLELVKKDLQEYLEKLKAATDKANATEAEQMLESISAQLDNASATVEELTTLLKQATPVRNSLANKVLRKNSGARDSRNGGAMAAGSGLRSAAIDKTTKRGELGIVVANSGFVTGYATPSSTIEIKKNGKTILTSKLDDTGAFKLNAPGIEVGDRVDLVVNGQSVSNTIVKKTDTVSFNDSLAGIAQVDGYTAAEADVEVSIGGRKYTTRSQSNGYFTVNVDTNLMKKGAVITTVVKKNGKEVGSGTSTVRETRKTDFGVGWIKNPMLNYSERDVFSPDTKQYAFVSVGTADKAYDNIRVYREERIEKDGNKYYYWILDSGPAENAQAGLSKKISLTIPRTVGDPYDFTYTKYKEGKQDFHKEYPNATAWEHENSNYRAYVKNGERRSGASYTENLGSWMDYANPDNNWWRNIYRDSRKDGTDRNPDAASRVKDMYGITTGGLIYNLGRGVIEDKMNVVKGQRSIITFKTKILEGDELDQSIMSDWVNKDKNNPMLADIKKRLANDPYLAYGGYTDLGYVRYREGQNAIIGTLPLKPEEAAKYDLKPKAKEQRTKVGVIPDAYNSIANPNELPAGTTYRWFKDPDVSRPTAPNAPVYGKVEVIIPERGTFIVDAPVHVVDDKAAKPIATAKDNGDVTAKPQDSTKVDKIKVSFTGEDNKPKTAEGNKGTNGKWTVNNPDVRIDANNGEITIPANKVKDLTEVTAITKNGNGADSDPAKAIAKDVQKPQATLNGVTLTETANSPIFTVYRGAEFNPELKVWDNSGKISKVNVGNLPYGVRPSSFTAQTGKDGSSEDKKYTTRLSSGRVIDTQTLGEHIGTLHVEGSSPSDSRDLKFKYRVVDITTKNLENGIAKVPVGSTLNVENSRTNVDAHNYLKVVDSNDQRDRGNSYLPQGMVWTWKAGDNLDSGTTLDNSGKYTRNAVAKFPTGTNSITDTNSTTRTTFAPTEIKRQVVLAVTPTSPSVVANKDGSVEITPPKRPNSNNPQDIDTITLTYTPTGKTTPETVKVTKTGNNWTVNGKTTDKVSVTPQGVVKIADLEVADGKEVTAKVSKRIDSNLTLESPVAKQNAKDAQKPTLTITPSSQTVVEGGKVEFTVTAKDNTSVTLDAKDFLNKYFGRVNAGKATSTPVKTTETEKVVRISITTSAEDIGKQNTITFNAADNDGNNADPVNFNFTVTARDTVGPTITANGATVTKNEPIAPISVTAVDNPGGVGLRDKNPIEVTGLPTGLTYANNRITGTPTAGKGDYPVTITAYDKNGNHTTSNITIKVQEQADKYNPTGETLTVNQGQAISDDAVKAKVKNFAPGKLTVESKPASTATAGSAGNAVVKVTYPDGSHDTVTVPVTVRDVTGPTITAEETTVTKNEEITPIPITAEDNAGGVGMRETNPITVSNLPAGLTYSNGKITGTTSARKGFYTLTITAYDKNNTPSTKKVKIHVQEQADKYTPTATELTVNQNEDITIEKLTPKVNNPGKGTLSLVNKPSTATAGTAGNAVVKVTYSDGSHDLVNVPITVKDVTGPTITANNATVTNREDITPISVTAKDNTGGVGMRKTNPIVVTGLPEGLTYADGQITGKPIGTAGESTVTITAYDKNDNPSTTTIKITVQSQAAAHNPRGERLTVDQNHVIEDSEVIAKVKDYAPATQLTVKSKPTTAVVGNPEDAVVTVTYPDGSSEDVNVPVTVRDTSVADTTGPTITADGATVTKNEPIKPISVTAEDNPGGVGMRDNDPIVVEGLPNGLTFKDGKITGTPTAPAGNYPVTIKAYDKIGNESEAPIKITIIVQEQKDKYTPTAEGLTVNQGHEITDDEVKAKVKDFAPGSLTVTSKPSTATTDNVPNAVVTVTYPDGSSETVDVPVTVKDVTGPTITADGATVTRNEPITPIPVNVSDNEGGRGLREENPVEVTGLPDGLTYANGEITGTPAKTAEKGGYTVTIKATDKDGNSTEKQITITVQTQADKYTPTGDSLKVDQGHTITDDEVTDKVKDNGPGELSVTSTPSTSTFGDAGNAIVKVTYPDGSTDEVKVPVTVSDVTGPKVTADGETVTKNEPITPIKVTVKDNEGGRGLREENPVEVTGLPDGLTYANGEITGTPTVPKGDYPVTIKAYDKDGNETTETITIKVQEQADKYNPTGEGLTVDQNHVIEDSEVIAKVKGNGPGTVTVESKPSTATKGNVGNAVAKVTYPDGSSEEVTVPVTVKDVTGPTITAEGATVTKNEPITPIPVTVTDNEGGSGLREENPVEVTDLPEGLTYANGQIIGTPTGNKGDYTVTIKAHDKDGNVTTQTITITVQEQADKYNPKYDDGNGKPGAKVEVPVTEEAGKTIPEGTKFESLTPGITVDDKGKVTVTIPEDKEPGDEIPGTIKVTYPDGSKEEVPVKVTVTTPDRDIYTPKYDDGEGKPGGTVELPLKEKDGKTIPEGTKFESLTPGITVDDKGKVTVTIPENKNPGDEFPGTIKVTYPDGSKEEVPVRVTVTNKDNDKYTPKYEGGSGKPGTKVEVPLKEEAGKKIPEGTKFESNTPGIAVDDKGKVTVTIPKDKKPGDVISGKVTVTYPDGSKDEVPVSVTVTDQDKDVYTPKYDDGTGIPGAKVEIPVTEENGKTIPEGTKFQISTPGIAVDDKGKVTVTIPEDKKPGDEITGKITVTYPDGSHEEVPVKVTVKTPDKDIYTPKYEDGNGKPGTKVEVPLKEETGKEIPEGTKFESDTPGITVGKDGKVTVTIPEGAKPGDKITGEITVTYPDGSTDTVPVEVTVREKDKDIYTPEYDKGNGKPGGTVELPLKEKAGKEIPEGTKFQSDNPGITVDKDGKVTVTIPEGAKPGDKITGTITVTYPDGSKDTVPVEVTVREKDKDIYTPEYDKGNGKPGGNVELPLKEKTGKPIPEGTKFESNTPGITVDKDGKVTVTIPEGSKPGDKITGEITVTYPDGSKDIVPVEVTVTNKDKDIYTPEYDKGNGKPGGTVELPLKEKAGKKIPEGTTFQSDNPGITVDKDGKVIVTIPEGAKPGDKITGEITVTYPDGTKDIVPVEVIVTNKDKDIYTPEYDKGNGKPETKVEIPAKEDQTQKEDKTPAKEPQKPSGETPSTTGEPVQQTQDTNQNILPNTGTADGLGIFSAAAASILSGLGLVVFGKKEDEESENN